MKIKPDLRVWAECLVETVKYNSLTVEQLVDIVEDNLNEIADKYYQMGDKNGWWEEQDKETRLTKEYEDAQKKIDNGEPVAGMFHCQCYKINQLAGNYNQSCWRCDGNY